MKTSKLIRITGDTAADVDAAIEMLCTSGLPIGISDQEEITGEIAEYVATEIWSIEYDLKSDGFPNDFAISLVERLTI